MGWAPVGPTRSKREEAEEPASQSRPKADLIRRGPTTLEPAMTALRANPTPSIPPTDSFEEPKKEANGRGGRARPRVGSVRLVRRARQGDSHGSGRGKFFWHRASK